VQVAAAPPRAGGGETNAAVRPVTARRAGWCPARRAPVRAQKAPVPSGCPGRPGCR